MTEIEEFMENVPNVMNKSFKLRISRSGEIISCRTSNVVIRNFLKARGFNERSE